MNASEMTQCVQEMSDGEIITFNEFPEFSVKCDYGCWTVTLHRTLHTLTTPTAVVKFILSNA